MNYYVYPILKNKPRISKMDKRKEIMLAVSEFTGVEPEKIQGRSRAGRIVYARHLFCLMARKFTRYGTNQIGEFLGRDHSTVINSTNRLKDLSDTEEEVRDDIKILSDKIEKRFA